MSLEIVAWVVGGLIVVAVGVVAAQRVWRVWRSTRRASETQQALKQFRMQRELLEAKFFDLAKASGKPRGLKWIDCDWQSEVTFARACDTGLLTAFVAVNVRFEAIEGGDMEDVAHVGTIRDAAAVFHFQKGRWSTGGKALFNMNPSEAVARLIGQFEPVV